MWLLCSVWWRRVEEDNCSSHEQRVEILHLSIKKLGMTTSTPVTQCGRRLRQKDHRNAGV